MANSVEQITREIMGNVPSWLAMTFYFLAFSSVGWAAWGFCRRILARRVGRKSPNRCLDQPNWLTAVVSGLKYLAFHQKLLQDRYAGIAHLLIVYGFFILFVGTCLVFLEHDTPLHFFYGRFYLIASLVVDLGGLAFLVGIGMFFGRRLAGRTDRLLRSWWVTVLGCLLAAIAVTGFLLEGARIATDFPPFEKWSVAGYGVALTLDALGISGDSASRLHRICWALHAALCVGFFVLLPWRFFSHAVYGLIVWATRVDRPLSQLASLSLTATESPGALAATDFGRRELLQVDACTTCGRCNEVCPARAAGKPLSPREIVLGVREALNVGGPLSDSISADALWSCTTCSACNSVCPVGIDIYDRIVDMRRGHVEAGDVPPAAETVFDSIASRFNPFQRPNGERLHWAHDLQLPVAECDEPIELLYWVGCAGSFTDEGRSIAQAMVKILNHLGIEYRVLGCAERCTGDPARRMGEEGLFQELARDNMALLRRHKVRRLLTHCPHCYNTLRNEYPSLLVAESCDVRPYEVIHHSQFLADCSISQKLPLGQSALDSLTFHDPCYLARGNGIVREPRDAIASAVGVPIVEMPRHGKASFCCGAGGGSMWLDVHGEERIENLRYREAQATGARTVVTACPFCKTMLQGSRQAAVADASDPCAIRVEDLAELIAKAWGL